MEHRGACKCKHRYRADAHYWNRLLNSAERVRNWIGHNAEHSFPGKSGRAFTRWLPDAMGAS